jgi:hypothetical protein
VLSNFDRNLAVDVRYTDSTSAVSSDTAISLIQLNVLHEKR